MALACMLLGWDLGAAVEHPSKEADVSGNATRYPEQQRLFPRRACLHKSVIIYTTRTRSTLKIVYTTVVRSVWILISAMTATPETTLWYTIKPRAFRRDYIRKQVEMYSCYYLFGNTWRKETVQGV